MKKSTSKSSGGSKALKIATLIARILVGLLFIFSGFIKANDPLGFSYKLDEYFRVFEDHIWSPLGWFQNISLGLSIFITGLEIFLGFILLTGSFIKVNRWLLLLLIVFFTFLTFYSAYTGYVHECGCFGDVIPLKAWQSFYKDLILLVLILLIFIGSKTIKPLITKPMADKGIVVILAIISFGIPVYANLYLPIHDFSDFAPGKNLWKQQMAYDSIIKKNDDMHKIKFIMKHKKTGKVRELMYDEYMAAFSKEPTFYEDYGDPIDRIDPPKMPMPPVADFKFLDVDSNDVTEDILANPSYQFILVEYDLTKANLNCQNEVNDLAGLAEKDKVSFIGVSYASWTEIENFRHLHQNAFDFYRCDDVALKAAIRSNPGLMLLKNGVVLAKWSCHAIPSYNSVKEQYMK